MTQVFESFIQPARERAELWRILCVFLVWVIVYFVLSILILMGLALSLTDLETLQALERNVFNTPLSMVLLLATFIAWVIALKLALQLFHKRGIATLLGKDPKLFGLYFALAVVGFGIFAVVMGLIFPENKEIVQNLDTSVWLRFLVPGVILMFIQVSAEELLFRGYLMQQLAVRFNSRWVYMGIPSVIFGAMHYDPSIGQSAAIMVICSAGLLGFFLADLTYRTGNLGAAIGIHFANNFASMFLVSYQEKASGVAWNIVPYYFENPSAIGEALKLEMGLFAIVILTYWVVMERRARI